jgi:DNA-binding transcriptional ArsR family regulator
MTRLHDSATDRLDDDGVHGRRTLPRSRSFHGTHLCEWSGFLVCSAIIDRSQLTEYDADDVLVVSEPEKLRALAGELRSRIVVLLRERAASTTELAEALGVPKGTMGHHLKVLERAGLVRVVATRRVRAVTEKYYGRVARLFVLSTADAAEGKQGEGAMAALILRRGADQVPLQGVDPQLVTAGLAHARLRPAAAGRLIRRLDKLFADFRALEDPEGELFALAASLFPTTPRLPGRDDA